MKWPAFVIFQRDCGFQASYLEISGDPEVFAFRGREYRFAGQCPFYHHMTDSENRLTGFVVDGVDLITNAPGWFAWIKSGDDTFSEDSNEAYFFLAGPLPKQFDHDCSALLAANVYHNGGGDFLVTIGDAKATGKDGQFQNLWSSIGFPLAPTDQFQSSNAFQQNLDQENIVLNKLLR